MADNSTPRHDRGQSKRGPLEQTNIGPAYIQDDLRIMRPSCSVVTSVRQIFEPTQRGVVGLADDLLKLCGEQRLQLEFRNDSCFIDDANCGNYRIDLPISKTVFRAVLARIAALCNEQRANSVTPYHGDGSLTIATNPPTDIHVAFTNTPDQQRLEMAPVSNLGSYAP